MKVFKVWVDRCSWDDFDSFVCVAESKEDILARFKEVNQGTIRYVYDIGDERFSEYGYGEQPGPFFKEDQVSSLDDFHIEEVDLTKESVIIASYNAG